ncbi:hypothetical protein [Streptomyces sp. NPDC051567]|uniref:hypothetical protein n=1 Tax=Streptomyces sp. NPDC051567 TaxID=3365660 RepID=UPI0037946559
MHPTRTTTTLLLGVACAVSAVSGCVQVSPAPVRPPTGPTSGVPPHHEPRGGPRTTLVTVQAPALEALEAVPDGSAHPVPAPTARRPAPGAAQGKGGGQGRTGPADTPGPAGRAGGGPHRERPDAGVPRELIRELPVRPADVCALGRKHGRWHPDSPEARICAGVHGG